MYKEYDANFKIPDEGKRVTTTVVVVDDPKLPGVPHKGSIVTVKDKTALTITIHDLALSISAPKSCFDEAIKTGCAVTLFVAISHGEAGMTATPHEGAIVYDQGLVILDIPSLRSSFSVTKDNLQEVLI